MWRRFWIAAGAIGAIVVFLVWTSTQTTFLFTHPRTKGFRVIIDKVTGGAVVTLPVAALPSAEEPLPQVQAEETTFNFGTMDPLTMGRHEFVVRNSGSAPLKLQVGPTTCKCTVSGLAKNEIPPGDFTTATLEWNTGRDLQYSHAGTILTNDPLRKSIELRVQGKVRMLIGADREELLIERMEPDQPAVIDTLLYSQLWDAFSVPQLESRTAGLAWEVAPVDPSSAQHLGAKSVCRLRLTVPGSLPQGDFQDSLRLTIQPSGEGASPHYLDLPLRGAVLRRLAFYGAAIDSRGVVDFGNVLEGMGKRVKLLAKVRDTSPDISAAHVEASPTFLKTELALRSEGQAGLYELTIELPDDVPPCQYNSSPIGRVRIDTHHPRIGTVELLVKFAVLPRHSL